MNVGGASLKSAPVRDWLVITDLDGTLLDHETYDWEPARALLRQLGALEVPVVFCSSKTAPEIRLWRRRLGNRDPYIAENGAAVYGLDGGQREEAARIFSQDHDSIIRALWHLRREQGYRFQGFTDMSVAEVVEATGLPESEAELARQRAFSEPLLWLDTADRMKAFMADLSRLGLEAHQGGRFLSISGGGDKGRALIWLRRYYERIRHRSLWVVALGDSPNDESMLDAADCAVVVRSGKSAQLHPTRPGVVVRTTESGPAGWAAAIQGLLDKE